MSAPDRAQHHTPGCAGEPCGAEHQGDARVHTHPAVADACGAVHVVGSPDAAIAAVAASQYGVVTRDQLMATGLGRGAIERRVSRGRLHRVHRGVYLVGHRAPPPLAREMAAVLACGPEAVLSHRSAAWLWQILPSPVGDVDVTIVGRDTEVRPGVRRHRVRRFLDGDLTRHRGVPVTTPARTLLDLAGAVGARELERSVDEGLVRGLVDRRRLRAAVARAVGRQGVAALRALLDHQDGPTLTRSEAEERMLALVRSAQLPKPRVNAHLGGREVDLLWSAQRLVVEVDGYAYHSSRSAFERDHLRDAELGAAGFRVMRVTWRLLVNQPEAVVARLAAALAQSAGAPHSET